MSPRVTQNCVAGNPLPTTYWLSGPEVGYHTVVTVGSCASYCEVYCLPGCHVAYSE